MADDAPVEDVPVEEEVEEEVEMSVLDALKEVSVKLSAVMNTFQAPHTDSLEMECFRLRLLS